MGINCSLRTRRKILQGSNRKSPVLYQQIFPMLIKLGPPKQRPFGDVAGFVWRMVNQSKLWRLTLHDQQMELCLAQYYEGKCWNEIVYLCKKIKVFFRYVCEICGATGSYSHTRKYCPFYNPLAFTDPNYNRIANALMAINLN